MSFWKVLGGAVAGVGAVACLPVFGAVGAVTAVGAAVGAAIGGLGGAALASSDEESVNNARDEGKREATAKYEREVNKLVEALHEAKNKLDGDKTYFQLVIALFAIGMATANADGDIAQEELDDLEQFVSGVSSSALPAHIEQQIQQFKENPPTLNTAIAYIQQLESPDITLFRSVIQMISESDGKVTDHERAFLAAFDQAISTSTTHQETALSFHEVMQPVVTAWVGQPSEQQMATFLTALKELNSHRVSLTTEERQLLAELCVMLKDSTGKMSAQEHFLSSEIGAIIEQILGNSLIKKAA